MKKQFRLLGVAILALGLFFSSCKKDSSGTNEAEEFKVQSDDQSRFSNETDEVTTDAVTAVENMGGSYNGETPLSPLLPSICNTTVTIDTVSVPRKITITYNGLNCAGTRIRTGNVVISFAPGFRWNQPNAQYSVAYQNLKITRVLDNKSITINGEKTIKNVTGGRLRNLATSGTSVVHEITSSGMSITFDNGTVRSWQLARRRTFSYNNGIVTTVEGIAPQGGGVAEWGTTRFGAEFTNSITQPLVFKQSCNFRLVSGQTTHVRGGRSSVVTFGLDASGNPITDCPSGPFYYKLVYTGLNGNSITVIAPY
ncbi:MAG: hypothetical protein RLY16_1368 [Bacteroidota bacterium]|jgi:hypothetical protein